MFGELVSPRIFVVIRAISS